MKRKLLSIILALTLSMSLLIPALATEPTNTPNKVDSVTISIYDIDEYDFVNYEPISYTTFMYTLTNVTDVVISSHNAYGFVTLYIGYYPNATVTPLQDARDGSELKANTTYNVTDIIDEDGYHFLNALYGLTPLEDFIEYLSQDYNTVVSIYDFQATEAPSPEPPLPPPPPDPLDGAANWAKEELGLALDAGLLIEDMFGKWPEDTSRLVAADAIVRLIEVSTGKTIDAIATEKDFDLSDKFADTDSKAATFLKASGISNGIDGVNYGYSGTFTRAQLVTMLGRMAESVFDMDLSDYPKGSDTFNDIPESMSWAEQYIGWAAALDITQGDGGADKFNPGGNLTNQQTGLFTYRAFDAVFFG